MIVAVFSQSNMNMWELNNMFISSKKLNKKES